MTLPSAVDIVCICPRRLLQSAETTTICHNMHLTQDPHVETTHKTRYHKKPSSGAALCGVVTGPLGGLRRDVRRSPDSQDAHTVRLNHRRNRCETAKHARVNPHSKVRQAWIVSGATQNFDTYVYLTHHQHQCLSAAAWDDPRHVLFTPCQHR